MAGQVEPEEYELHDYDKATQQAELQRSRREEKRAEKRRRLEEADEMKFSHSIQFNAVPDWSSHYISYSNLKKLYLLRSTFLRQLLTGLEYIRLRNLYINELPEKTPRAPH